MSGTSDTKCMQCGKWQIKIRYCPYCGHDHTTDPIYGSEYENKIYTCNPKEGG
jgi:ribosomal protein L32